MARAAKHIAAAAGTASAGSNGLHFSVIQDAMDAAALACHKKGIVDPDVIREEKLKARERVKREQLERERKAARQTKS